MHGTPWLTWYRRPFLNLARRHVFSLSLSRIVIDIIYSAGSVCWLLHFQIWVIDLWVRASVGWSRSELFEPEKPEEEEDCSYYKYVNTQGCIAIASTTTPYQLFLIGEWISNYFFASTTIKIDSQLKSKATACEIIQYIRVKIVGPNWAFNFNRMRGVRTVVKIAVERIVRGSIPDRLYSIDMYVK